MKKQEIQWRAIWAPEGDEKRGFGVTRLLIGGRRVE